MSRAYRISVKESVKRDISGTDGICAELELLDILPEDRMRSLLADELRKRGFTEKDGQLERSRQGIAVRIDPRTGEVKVNATAEKQIDVESERETYGFDDLGPKEDEIKAHLRKEALRDIDHRVEEHRKKLQEKATAKLEGSLQEVSKELDQIVNAVTRAALKQKAATLGTIREISENAETGSLTIKVEV